MLSEAIAAYAHDLSIFCTLALLVAELAVFRPRMDRNAVRLLPQLDLLYLLAVIAVIATGLVRLFFFAKGVAFYAASEIFWIKMALFAVVGLLSLPPTFAFIATRKAAAGQGFDLPPARFKRIRTFIVGELAVFSLIPLAATLMARGLTVRPPGGMSMERWRPDCCGGARDTGAANARKSIRVARRRSGDLGNDLK